MSCKSSAEQTCLLCRGVADNRAKIYNCRTPTTSGEDWQFSNSIIRDENMMIAGGHKTRPYDFGGGVAFGLRGTSWRGDAGKRRPLPYVNGSWLIRPTTPKGWQNDNFIHFISLLCHPFGVVDFISSSSRGYASLHHLPVVVPALRASLHNRLPYKTNYSFVRQFYFRNLSYIILKIED